MARKNPGEPFYRINAEEAKEMVDSGEAVAVVDVRNPDEYAAGHVKDAIFMPVDTVLARVDELPRDKKLLFICAMGQRSALACEMSAAMGLDPGEPVQHRGRHARLGQPGLPHQLRRRAVTL